ncbi:MAG: hypothetical protein U1F52_11310 [Burkholderiales bacterium]
MRPGTLSYAASLALTANDPADGFYLPLSRGWERLTGALLAQWARRRPGHTAAGIGRPWCRGSGQDSPIPSRRPAAVEGGALLGLALVLGASIVWAAADLYPGRRAVLPVTGTASFLAAPGIGFHRAVLSRRPMAALGLISDPLSLWHWPLLSFHRLIEGRDAAVGERIALLTASVLAAALTYRWIERPVRSSPRTAVTAAMPGAAMVVVAAAGFPVLLAPGAARRPAAPGIGTQRAGGEDNRTGEDLIKSRGCAGNAIRVIRSGPP